MDTAKNQITPAIKEQILKVRDTGETNMFDCGAVISIANREGWPECGPIMINYDRGWDIKPKNAEEEKTVDTILAYCRHVYDGVKDSLQPSIDMEAKR